MILRRATVVKMKMMMMTIQMHLTPTSHKESIQITIHTGNGTVPLTHLKFLLFRMNLYSCLFSRWMSLQFYHLFFVFFFFKQLVFDAFDNGSAGVGQPEIVLPNGRI